MKNSFATRLPDIVKSRAATFGEAGQAWLSGLNECVQALEQQWTMQAHDVLTGGSESLVISTRLHTGEAAVLKIGLPGSADLNVEARVYKLSDGRGYAKLYAQDDSRNAILIEQLGPSLGSLNLPVETQIQEICRALDKTWIKVDNPQGFMTGAEKAQWLATFIREQFVLLERPCDKMVIERALSYIEERIDAYSPADSVLVHGDAHGFNTLVPMTSGDISQCKFIDPDGLFAERACDLAVLMRDWSAELLEGNTNTLGRSRAAQLSAITNVPFEPIWQWGYIERVSTGLMLLSIGMKQEGLQMLAVASIFARSER